MAFVVIGVLLLVLHVLGIGPTADWDPSTLMGFVKFAIPFLLALGWWAWADASGWTKRREMQRDQERKSDRRRRQVEAMGMGPDAKHNRGSRR